MFSKLFRTPKQRKIQSCIRATQSLLSATHPIEVSLQVEMVLGHLEYTFKNAKRTSSPMIDLRLKFCANSLSKLLTHVPSEDLLSFNKTIKHIYYAAGSDGIKYRVPSNWELIYLEQSHLDRVNGLP